jgi:hypothetical protein
MQRRKKWYKCGDDDFSPFDAFVTALAFALFAS